MALVDGVAAEPRTLYYFHSFDQQRIGQRSFTWIFEGGPGKLEAGGENTMGNGCRFHLLDGGTQPDRAVPVQLDHCPITRIIHPLEPTNPMQRTHNTKGGDF